MMNRSAAGLLYAARFNLPTDDQLALDDDCSCNREQALGHVQ
jgi:hypothetical protein